MKADSAFGSPLDPLYLIPLPGVYDLPTFNNDVPLDYSAEDFAGGEVGLIPVYWGKHPGTSIDAAGILVLNSFSQSSVDGSYVFTEGPGYAYFAFPLQFEAAAAINVGFNMALAGVPQGYTTLTNGLRHDIVTVNGREYRVYRSYYELNGSFTATAE